MNAETYGDAASLAAFHGRITASRKIEPTKKIAIRKITELVGLGDRLLRVGRLGRRDRRDLGADHREDHHDDADEDRAGRRAGRSRRGSVRLLKSIALLRPEPDDEQGAEDDEDDDRGDLDPGEPELELAERGRPRTGWSRSSAPSGPSDEHHSGTLGIQYCRIFAPATASKPTTITQKYQ